MWIVFNTPTNSKTLPIKIVTKMRKCVCLPDGRGLWIFALLHNAEIHELQYFLYVFLLIIMLILFFSSFFFLNAVKHGHFFILFSGTPSCNWLIDFQELYCMINWLTFIVWMTETLTLFYFFFTCVKHERFFLINFSLSPCTIWLGL